MWLGVSKAVFVVCLNFQTLSNGSYYFYQHSLTLPLSCKFLPRLASASHHAGLSRTAFRILALSNCRFPPFVHTREREVGGDSCQQDHLSLGAQWLCKSDSAIRSGYLETGRTAAALLSPRRCCRGRTPTQRCRFKHLVSAKRGTCVRNPSVLFASVVKIISMEFTWKITLSTVGSMRPVIVIVNFLIPNWTPLAQTAAAAQQGR